MMVVYCDVTVAHSCKPIKKYSIESRKCKLDRERRREREKGVNVNAAPPLPLWTGAEEEHHYPSMSTFEI